MKVLGRHGQFSLVKKSEKLPCCKHLERGRCGSETHYALAVEHGSYTSVYPYCEEHLPQWAFSLVKKSKDL